MSQVLPKPVAEPHSPDPTRGSVTKLLEQVRSGEADALARIVTRFWGLLLSRAGRRLGGTPRRAADEEDVAQEVWTDVASGLTEGRWPELVNRHDLVALLTQVAECKAINQAKRELARKRGGGAVWDEARLGQIAATESGNAGLDRVATDPSPPPPDVVLRADWWEHCLSQLPDAQRRVAELRLAGNEVAEVAELLGCSERTVARKLALIRTKWSDLLGDERVADAKRES
jgi:DNA-directed RNA polymerase specialized sigma24 family protein